jgi:hypothetical protein
MVNPKEITINHRGKTGGCNINEFDLNTMVDHPSIVMIAKRGSGKSWVVRAILQHFSRKVPVGIIISPTDRMSSFYADFIPDTYIYFKFESETIERLLSRQKNIIKKQKERKKMGKETNTRSFIVMDDCLGSKGDWAKDPFISELLFNGRHYHIMYILTMQFPLGIKPELRCNFDYIFLLADDTVSNQKRIFEHYAGAFPNFEAFRQVFIQLTADYGSMVIVNRGVRDNFLEKIYYYKAPNCTDFKGLIGGGQYKKFHSDNYNEQYQNKTKDFDPDVAFSRKRLQGSKLAVNKVERAQQVKSKNR